MKDLNATGKFTDQCGNAIVIAIFKRENKK
jgi:hypothetical protein